MPLATVSHDVEVVDVYPSDIRHRLTKQDQAGGRIVVGTTVCNDTMKVYFKHRSDGHYAKLPRCVECYPEEIEALFVSSP